MSVVAWIVLLYVGGILLLLAEFFVPGGVLGVLGGAMIIASGIWGAYLYPDQAFAIVVGELIGVLAAILLGVLLLSKTNLARGFILGGEFTQEGGYVSDETDSTLLGAIAEVYSALRPAGMIVVDGRRVSAVSDGSFIDKGAKVRVIEVRGNRVVVERID
jgi:membrane-bound serine protease (ClpP class)